MLKSDDVYYNVITMFAFSKFFDLSRILTLGIIQLPHNQAYVFEYRNLYYHSLNVAVFVEGYQCCYQIDLVYAGHLQSEEGCNDQRKTAVFDNGFGCYYS